MSETSKLTELSNRLLRWQDDINNTFGNSTWSADSSKNS